MSLGRCGSSVGVVAATVVGLLLLAPGPRLEHLERPGHVHVDSQRVSVEAAHRTLPAHFDASLTTAERICSACLLHGRTVIRSALVPGAEPLPPAVSPGSVVDPWIPGNPQSRLVPSRAPPTIL